MWTCPVFLPTGRHLAFADSLEDVSIGRGERITAVVAGGLAGLLIVLAGA